MMTGIIVIHSARIRTRLPPRIVRLIRVPTRAITRAIRADMEINGSG